VIVEASVDGRVIRVEIRGPGPRYDVVVDGRALSVDVEQTGRRFLSLLVDGRSHEVGVTRRGQGFSVALAGDTFQVELRDGQRGVASTRSATSGPARVAAPMPGKVVRVLVGVGQPVAAGEPLVVIEAMKMENELKAPRAGRIGQIAAREGQAVEAGATLAVVE